MKSMTGFGRASIEENSHQYIVEIKSVNHRYKDITVKVPRSLLSIENEIREIVSKFVARGKIDVYVTYLNFGVEGKKVVINKNLAKLYIEELRAIAKENQISDNILVTEISKFPEVLNIENVEENVIQEELLKCLYMALDKFVEMKQTEGSKIQQDLLERMKKVEEIVQRIYEYSAGLVEEYVVKLENRVNEILNADVIDKTRLLQEIVIYADKCSVEEELTRLKSHISQFYDLNNLSCIQGESVGKKIDFLIQEMNREINTIGSKSGSIEITNCVIELKAMIEDVREQIQNIE